MPVRSGERAKATGDFRCQDCDHVIHVGKGDIMPECPCGSGKFEERMKEAAVAAMERRQQRRP